MTLEDRLEEQFNKNNEAEERFIRCECGSITFSVEGLEMQCMSCGKRREI